PRSTGRPATTCGAPTSPGSTASPTPWWPSASCEAGSPDAVDDGGDRVGVGAGPVQLAAGAAPAHVTVPGRARAGLEPVHDGRDVHGVDTPVAARAPGPGRDGLGQV